MRKIIFQVFFLSLLLLAATSSQAMAQSKSTLKGQWLFNFTQPQGGVLPAPIVFGNGNKGTVATPLGVFPLTYRETDTSFSGTSELPQGLPSDGSDISVLVRGVKKSATSVTGTSLFITEKPEPSSPLGIMVIVLTFEGNKQK